MRALLVGAYLCIVFAFAAAWISYTAGSSGYKSDHDDAWFWGAAAAFLIVVGMSSFTVWWRVTGRPRHY
jgi:O-antigen/teichoic acid export membrane protein